MKFKDPVNSRHPEFQVFVFGCKRTIVNLAPANIKKIWQYALNSLSPSLFLRCMEKSLPIPWIKQCSFGELSLDGSIKAINGCLALVTACQKTDSNSHRNPIDNRKETELYWGYIFFLRSHYRSTHYNQDTIYSTDQEPCIKSRVPEGRARHKICPRTKLCKLPQKKLPLRWSQYIWRGHQALENQWWLKHLLGLLPPLSKSEAIETTNIFSIIGDVPTDLLPNQTIQSSP